MPRASWKGFLRVSLVTCPVAIYPAISSTERISFNRINRATGQRVRQMNVDGKTGERVEPDDIVKRFQIDKGRYVLIDDSELDAIQIEPSKIINVTQFVDAGEVDPFFLDSPYFMAPDGDMAEETYRVIRAAMEETGTAGIGSIVLSSRERRVLLTPKGKGIAMTTLRTAREVRSAEAYFAEVRDAPVEGELLDMAKMLVERSRQPFEPAELVDRYEGALRNLVAAKTRDGSSKGQPGAGRRDREEASRARKAGCFSRRRRSAESSTAAEGLKRRTRHPCSPVLRWGSVGILRKVSLMTGAQHAQNS